MHIQPDAFAALRYRDFSIVTLNQFCLTLAILIQEIIVAYSRFHLFPFLYGVDMLRIVLISRLL